MNASDRKLVYEMTEEIAFELGKFDFPSFYQIALWKINKEPFPLAHFFSWTVPGGMGWPCKQLSDGSYETDWENLTVGGRLKTEHINSIPLKLAYVRGRLQSYSVTVTDKTIKVYYANSYEFRDFFAQCLRDILTDKYWAAPNNMMTAPKWTICVGETLGTIPGTPWVKLEGDEEVVKYIVGKE